MNVKQPAALQSVPCYLERIIQINSRIICAAGDIGICRQVENNIKFILLKNIFQFIQTQQIFF